MAVDKEKGEVMLEGMIVTLITTFLLVWVLGLGFVYYQRYLVTAITNDAAAKVAATYNNPDSDLIMGYISTENISERDLYRHFTKNKLYELNKAKATAYINYVLDKTNFAGTIQSVNVEMELVNDSALRKHIEITSECTFNTPFGFALDFFGMDGTTTYSCSSRADSTDISDYITTVDFASYQLGGNGVNSDVLNMINSLIGIFNHVYE